MARLHLYNGHPEDARELLVSFRERAAAEEKQKIVWNIENMLCQIAMYTEQKTEVDAWLLQAPDENQEFYCMERYRYLTKVHIYLAMKRYDAANALLQKLLYYARIYGRTYIQMECELLDVLLQRNWDCRGKIIFRNCSVGQKAMDSPESSHRKLVWYTGC